MSLRLIPETLAASPPLAVDRPAPQRPDTRPIEHSANSGKAGANGSGSQGQSSGSTNFAAVQAAMSPRPPGTDPSVPPQSLFDASLISATFKPTLQPADLQKQSEDLAEDEAERASQITDDGSGQDDSGAALAAAGSGTDTTGGAHQIDAGKLAAYSLGSGGSPLSAASSTNPDWLSAIERLA